MLFKFKELTKSSSKGFTIVELLIAVAGFSFVLILVTVVMINIGSLSSKGINQTKIDDAARYIVDDVSLRLKFNRADAFSRDSSDDPESGAYCVSNIKYVYSFNSERNYLYRMPQETTGCIFPANPMPIPGGATNLLPTNTRLTYFNISNNNPLNNKQFTIKVALLYGSPANAENSRMSTKCKLGSSYQYCAVTGLETVVTSRLN